MTKHVWDQFYKKRGRYFLSPHEGLIAFYRILLQNIRSTHKVQILDLGGGSGINSIELANLDAKVTTLEQSAYALLLLAKWAKEKDLEIKTLLGDLHSTLPFKTNEFDGILALNSLVYDTLETIPTTIDELRRIIKPDGYAFFSFPTKDTKSYVLELLLSQEEIHNLLKYKFKIIKEFYDKQNCLALYAKVIK